MPFHRNREAELNKAFLGEAYVHFRTSVVFLRTIGMPVLLQESPGIESRRHFVVDLPGSEMPDILFMDPVCIIMLRACMGRE